MTSINNKEQESGYMKMRKKDLHLFLAIVLPLQLFAFIEQFIARSQWHDANKLSGIGWNIVGIVAYTVSIVSLFFTWKWAGENKSHPGFWLWMGGLVVGALTSLPGYGVIF